MDEHQHPEHHQREYTDPHCESPATLARLLRDAPWRRVALVGDSIAVGLGDPVEGYQDASWVERLVTSLDGGRRRVDQLNLGVIGARAAEIHAGQLERALSFGPDLVVVSSGGNDLFSRRFDLPQVVSHVEAVVDALSSAGAVVVTFGIFDVSIGGFIPPLRAPGFRRRVQELNCAVARVTARHDGVFVDCFDHPALSSSVFSADQLHPNRRGHAVIATEMVLALRRRLVSRPADSAA
jgi:lysophospholipase L1-like esterase